MPDPDTITTGDYGSDEQDVQRLGELVEAEAEAHELAPAVAELEPADAADALEGFEPEAQAQVVHHMDNVAAAEALAHMEVPLAASVLSDLPTWEAGQLLGMMDPDDAADIVQQFDEPTRATILDTMHPRAAATLGKLVLYEPESAGGIMTTKIGVVRESMRIGQAIDWLKVHEIDDAQNELYVVDDQKRLVGTISLRRLLILDDDKDLASHIDRDFDAVGTDVDREEVARVFERYDLLTLPIVDEHGRVLGMVTIDDVVDIIAAEATEDAFRQVGAGDAEAVYSPITDKLKGRGPWLLANLLMAQVGSVVLLLFTDMIALIPAVAIVYPIIANQTGNAGQQSMAITLRGLVLGEIRPERIWPLLRREVLFGVLSGLGVGIVFAIGAAMLGPLAINNPVAEAGSLAWFWFGLVCGGAMAIALTLGCLVGTAMPLCMQRLGIDPATAAALFVTMVTDAVSYGVFLGLVVLAKPLLLG
ncbi:MAG: magnesium transporter [Phycisphaerales bacterium]